MENAVLIVVEESHVFVNEVVLDAVCSDTGRTSETFIETIQYRRSRDGVQTLELPRGSHVELLQW